MIASLVVALGMIATDVNLTAIDGTDYAVCHVEDCSDQPGQVGLWLDTDTGDWYLSLGETSIRVIDDTAGHN